MFLCADLRALASASRQSTSYASLANCTTEWAAQASPVLVGLRSRGRAFATAPTIALMMRYRRGRRIEKAIDMLMADQFAADTTVPPFGTK
jgi:hypothetical protein